MLEPGLLHAAKLVNTMIAAMLERITVELSGARRSLSSDLLGVTVSL
jgi:hypothetical protein